MYMYLTNTFHGTNVGINILRGINILLNSNYITANYLRRFYKNHIFIIIYII